MSKNKAAELKGYVTKRRLELVGKPSDDEVAWATAQYKEVLPFMAQAAKEGRSHYYLDIPEADVIRVADEMPLLKGGARILTAAFEGSGFTVQVFRRHPGHSHGEYCLLVQW